MQRQSGFLMFLCWMKVVGLLGLLNVWCLPCVRGNDLRQLIFKDTLANSQASRWQSFGGQVQSLPTVVRVSGQQGPRAMLSGVQVDDFELRVDIKPEARTQAGVVFRVDDSRVGVDAYRGYYVGLHADANRVIWGASKPGWNGIAGCNRVIQASRWYRLRIRVAGANVKCFVDDIPVVQTTLPAFDGVDQEFDEGGIGLRVLGTAAEFRNLVIHRVVAESRGSVYCNPVQAGCADPAILRHGELYYAYCTHSPDYPDMMHGIRLHVSKDLVHWEDKGYVLKRQDSWGESRFWAPDIIEKDGKFFLYYAADTRLCVATADRPTGPFRQVQPHPMEPDTLRIDAHVFRDTDGMLYFYYVDFDRGNEIWGGRLNEDMVSVDEDSLQRMIVPDQAWEKHRGNIVEGPEMLKHNGHYYLTYSGSHFESPEYAVGYATSTSPLGPWKKCHLNPIMQSTAYARGTAHHCFTRSPDGSELFIVYHRHHSQTKTEPRQLSIDRAKFVIQKSGPDLLQIHGPTSSPQPMPASAKN